MYSKVFKGSKYKRIKGFQAAHIWKSVLNICAGGNPLMTRPLFWSEFFCPYFGGAAKEDKTVSRFVVRISTLNENCDSSLLHFLDFWKFTTFKRWLMMSWTFVLTTQVPRWWLPGMSWEHHTELSSSLSSTPAVVGRISNAWKPREQDNSTRKCCCEEEHDAKISKTSTSMSVTVFFW